MTQLTDKKSMLADKQTICADLIPNIVSYVTLNDLRVLSKVSPLFDIEIFGQDIRVLYFGRKGIRLGINNRVINLDDHDLGIIDLDTQEIRRNLGESVSFIECEVTTVNKCNKFFSGGTYSFDLSALRIFCEYDELKFYVLRVDSLEINREDIHCTVHRNVHTISKSSMNEFIVAREEYLGNIGYLDLENGYHINYTDDHTMTYCKIATIFDGRNWQ